MKKIISLLAVLVFAAPAVFAQTQLNTSAIERAARQSLNEKKAEQTMQLEKKVWQAWKLFRKQADTFAYYEYSFMFQSMDSLRQAYMELRAFSAEAAVSLAPRLNEWVYVNGHQRGIRLVSYINMETCNLAPSEQEKFEAFGSALEADLRQAVALPDDFVQAVESFREDIGNSREMNVSWVLQSVMPLMDAFQKQVKEHPALGPVMAKEIQKPIQAGWGKWVVPSQFIKDHSCEVWPVQDELDAFAAQLEQLSK